MRFPFYNFSNNVASAIEAKSKVKLDKIKV
jgi:hypothetical protein